VPDDVSVLVFQIFVVLSIAVVISLVEIIKVLVELLSAGAIFKS